ncbi:polymer-forming cytoskeletal protein [PVC group bacterium]|nr:polymer-forming cytoskeletal protein [PVC group bacterium]
MEGTERVKTIIGEDVEITGGVKCESSIQIDGKLNGDLTCNGTATIGGSSAIKGNLSGEMVMISGQVNGNIVAKDKIELKSTARLHGDIRSRRLTVEDGTTFVGKVDVNPAGPQSGGRQSEQSNSKPTQQTEADKTEAKDDTDKGKGIFGKKSQD